MKRKILIGNWKMNKTMKETLSFIGETKEVVESLNEEEFVVGIASSFLCLPLIRKLGGKLIGVAQNLHYEESGAFTGEISASMLEEIGVDFSLIGHSERRQNFNETNSTCNLKLKTMEKHNMNAIYCVGETLSEYEEGKGEEVVKTQILEAIEGLSENYVSSLVIAYEPIWAIGTGNNATSEDANNMALHIIETIKEKYGEKVSDKVYVLYGGSVNEDNIKDYVDKENIDGVLVGGASLDPKSFVSLINKLKELE